MKRKFTKSKKTSVSPVLIGALALGAGYMINDYISKKKLNEAMANVQKNNTATGTQSNVQTIANLYTELQKSGWLTDIKNIIQ